jgi:GNAT superfamily N-acetyltransferase
MAVDPSRQGSGIGGLVLAEAVLAAREAGAPMLWANGRTAALRFYERHGWVVAGEEFTAADTNLPHYPIVLPLALSEPG